HGVRLGPAEGGEGIALAGAIRDAYWGDWSGGLRQDKAAGTMTLDLEAADAQGDQKKLDALPFVPQKVWEEGKAAGQTPVKLRIRIGPKDDEVHYRVELRPRATTVTVTGIDLTFTNAQGQLTIEDNRLKLTGVTGEVAGGKVTTESDMDFSGLDSLMRFEVVASGVRC